MHEMRIGVIDVGSNTTRLLVASAGPDALIPLDKQKVRLSLGAEIERFGAVSAVHRAAAVKAVREMATTARRSRVASLDVFLTAPGRQAGNAAENLQPTRTSTQLRQRQHKRLPRFRRIR